MKKTISTIILSLVILTPIAGLAQTSEPALPTLPGIINLSAPISDFMDKLKNINVGGSAMPSGGSSIDLSSVKGFWASINNWFVSNIGISFTDIIKAVFNLIIWIWEVIIKLIQAGLSYL
ncbi:hypothetical protein D4R51_01760 [bacterium]|nr:MAG: hypothetical protein D4R51_01760 [bacterium]